MVVKKREDYLDIEKLLEDYSPLMKAIFKKFSAYNGLCVTTTDFEDLESQIKFEFIKLCNEYNPTRGVDFPGFIKFHLQQRVYHQVTKLQKVKQNETCVYNKTSDGEQEDSIDLDNTIDEESIKEFNKIDSINSIDWTDIPGDYNRYLVKSILDGKTIDEIAMEENVSPKVLRFKIISICDFITKRQEQLEKEAKDFNSIKRIAYIRRVPIKLKRISM